MVIEVIGFEDVADATKWTGEPTVDPGAGDETVTPANAVAAAKVTMSMARAHVFSDLLNIKKETPENLSA